MLTKVYLEGEMGKQFGKEWELEFSSPGEAMRLIDANSPGLQKWVYDNIEKYARYQVIAEYEDGTLEYLEDQTYAMERVCVALRYIPVIEGAGGNGSGTFITGAVLFVIGAAISYFSSGTMAAFGVDMMKAGAMMMIGGVVQMLTPVTSLDTNSSSDRKDKTSYYFDGPVNTARQGVPVPLIYGRCLVGSIAISADLSIDQLI